MAQAALTWRWDRWAVRDTGGLVHDVLVARGLVPSTDCVARFSVMAICHPISVRRESPVASPWCGPGLPVCPVPYSAEFASFTLSAWDVQTPVTCLRCISAAGAFDKGIAALQAGHITISR